MYFKSRFVIESIFQDFSFLFNGTQDRKVYSALSFQISWIKKSFERLRSKLHNQVVTHVPIPNIREISCRFLCLLRPYFPLCVLLLALTLLDAGFLRYCNGQGVSQLLDPKNSKTQFSQTDMVLSFHQSRELWQLPLS